VGKIKNTALDTIHSILTVVLILWAIVFLFALRESYMTYPTTIPVITTISELREHIGGRVEIIAPVVEPTGVSYRYRRRRTTGLGTSSFYYTTARLHALILEDGDVAFRTTTENFNAGETIIVGVRGRAYDRIGDVLMTSYDRGHRGRDQFLRRHSGTEVRRLYGGIVLHRAGTIIDGPMLYIIMLALAGLGIGGMLLWVRKNRKPAHGIVY